MTGTRLTEARKNSVQNAMFLVLLVSIMALLVIEPGALLVREVMIIDSLHCNNAWGHVPQDFTNPRPFYAVNAHPNAWLVLSQRQNVQVAISEAYKINICSTTNASSSVPKDIPILELNAKNAIKNVLLARTQHLFALLAMHHQSLNISSAWVALKAVLMVLF